MHNSQTMTYCHYAWATHTHTHNHTHTRFMEHERRNLISTRMFCRRDRYSAVSAAINERVETSHAQSPPASAPARQEYATCTVQLLLPSGDRHVNTPSQNAHEPVCTFGVINKENLFLCISEARFCIPRNPGRSGAICADIAAPERCFGGFFSRVASQEGGCVRASGNITF
jgi:hypothetical protein